MQQVALGLEVHGPGWEQTDDFDAGVFSEYD